MTRAQVPVAPLRCWRAHSNPRWSELKLIMSPPSRAAYRGIRRCRLEGTYGRPVQAWRTVGPGCSHAMTLIKLYTLSSLDRVENRNPGVRMSVLVS